MEELRKEHGDLKKRANYDATIQDVDKMIAMLENARNSITSNPNSAPLALAKMKTPLKTGFEQVNSDLKKVYSSLNSYSKALNKSFKPQDLSAAENEAISSETFLVNRAIAMHLLREGQFSVASTFIKEANGTQTYFNPPTVVSSSQTSSSGVSQTAQPDRNGKPGQAESIEQNAQGWEIRSEALQKEFSAMYHILAELKTNHNLAPAIDWARKHSKLLETRGSNLEFDLCRLQFISQFKSGGNSADGPLRAWAYARSEFTPFQYRYATEIQQLVGALAFWENISDSPYARIFQNSSAWEEVASSFTKEFCSLLGLSADSPLYVAATAGAIALPNLLKVKSVMKASRTEWTTSEELPVEIPLPPAYHFHSIFVCPVSKEQATDSNPPMMMPCGHVICKESLDRVSKGTRFKCPYCPGESHPRDAKKVYL